MTCPSCGGELDASRSSCPVCDAGATPRVEGALAADPRYVTPQAKPRVESLRDIPGLRKKEKTWRDEVQERVKSRRQKRARAGLPLFEAIETPAPPSPAPTPSPRGAQGAIEPPVAPAPAVAPAPPVAPAPLIAPAAPASRLAPAPPPDPAPAGGSQARPSEEFVTVPLSEAELGDLPLNADEAAAETLARERDASALPRATRRAMPSLDDEQLLAASEAEPEVELPPLALEAPPLERPALALERAQAGALDAVLFAALALVVIYFTGRAARVSVLSLAPGWPGLAFYLGLLALFYAGYFTGTTGQTPGKLITGLRVVGTNGRPPSYARAMARAALGTAGIALAGAFLVPMAFDPARRALHDRLFRTRVIRG